MDLALVRHHHRQPSSQSLGTGIVRCAYRNIVEVPPAYCIMNDLLSTCLYPCLPRLQP